MTRCDSYTIYQDINMYGESGERWAVLIYEKKELKYDKIRQRTVTATVINMHVGSLVFKAA